MQLNIVVGDYIQWESQGILFFETPRAVKQIAVFGGEKYIIVEDGPTGIPLNQVKITQRCLDHYGDGRWVCSQCSESWTSKLLHKHQIPIPCYCPHCNKELLFKK
jgi:hypothetical protein